MFSILLFISNFIAQMFPVVEPVEPEEILPAHEPVYGPIHQFWTDYQKILIENAPPPRFLMNLNYTAPVYRHFDDTAALRPRPENIEVSWRKYDRFREAHQNMVRILPELATKLPFDRQTSGIVMTTMKRDIDMLIIAIKMLRKSKTTLPVEVFLDGPKDNHKDFCNQLLPGLNAKCRYYSDFLTPDIILRFKIRSYSFKALALLFSSFENVFFLDTDNIVTSKIDSLFISEPFTKYGMVVWPDFWSETVARVFFHITDREVPVNLTHPSAESGQLMISKTMHGDSLLLAVYYNIYGDHQYYKVFSSNCWGEGDKDTFHNAAYALRKKFYFVKTSVEQLSMYRGEDFWENLAMIQHHPIDDYKRYEEKDESVKVRKLFIHSNFCKFQLKNIMTRGSKAITWRGVAERAYPSVETMIDLFGYDVEKHAWDSAMEVAHIFHPELIPKLEMYYRIVFFQSGERTEPSDFPYDFMNICKVVILVLAIIVLIVRIGKSSIQMARKKVM